MIPKIINRRFGCENRVTKNSSVRRGSKIGPLQKRSQPHNPGWAKLSHFLPHFGPFGWTTLPPLISFKPKVPISSGRNNSPVYTPGEPNVKGFQRCQICAVKGDGINLFVCTDGFLLSQACPYFLI